MKIDINSENMTLTFPDHSVTLSLDNVRDIIETYNRMCFREDVTGYFEDPDNGFDAKILENTELIDKIANTYYEKRYDADGGDEESNLHWRECLYQSINEFETELEPYRL